MKDLSTAEINLVLEKIRAKYTKLISHYNKSKSLLDNFEDRYIFALKLRKNLTMFLMAEIEAVEEIFKNEEKKHSDFIEQKYAKAKPAEKSFADKVLDENKKRYSRYTRINIASEAEDEVCFLSGAARDFLNNKLPIAVLVTKSLSNTTLNIKINNIYNEIIENINYKGDVPIAKHYTAAIITKRDNAKIIFEYQKLIQNIGFLLNSLSDILKLLLTALSESKDGSKITAVLLKNAGAFGDNTIKQFDKSSYLDTIKTIKNELDTIITDFRLKDIRKV